MPKKPRDIPPVTYHPETGELIWRQFDDYDPLDVPLNGSNDRLHLGYAVLKIMEDQGILPEDIKQQILLANLARQPLRVGDLLSPLLERLGLEPYRDMPPKLDTPTVVTRFLAESDPTIEGSITSKYATLYLFINNQILNELNISQIRAASYYAVLIDHFSVDTPAVVEELLSAHGGGVLSYSARDRLNWWVINGETLTDLYDALCKQNGCKGECDQTHIPGFDEKAVRLLAAVLQESTPLAQ